jgi:hypothetical protein
VNRLLAALAGRLFPGRGRHQRLPDPDDTADLPVVPVRDDGPSPGEVTRLDIPPFRVRPYVDGDEDDDDEGGTGEYRGFLP